MFIVPKVLHKVVLVYYTLLTTDNNRTNQNNRKMLVLKNLDDLSPRIKQLKTRKEQLESQQWELEWQLKSRKVELSYTETVAQYVNDLRTLLSESSLTERKSFIRSFVKEITVTGDHVKLEYTIPLGENSFIAENLAVPHIVHYGGADGIRTHYLLNANQTLSQLSYSPTRQSLLY